MEQIVYCQDQIYQSALQRVRQKDAGDEKNSKNTHSRSPEEASPLNISLSEIFEHLLAYRQVSLQVPQKGGFRSFFLSVQCLSL